MKSRFGLPVLLLALAAGGCASTNVEEGGAQPAARVASAMDLRMGMRNLWADHVGYTRNYIISAVTGDAGLPAVTDRLMKNQEDIGNAIAPYYGAAAASQLTNLLKDHIRVAGEVVAAAKANDSAKLKDADTRWHQNADQIAAFLSGANPNWNKTALLNMLNEHLSLTTQEATARLQGRWADDIATYDKVFTQAMMMADALSDGILKQFPPST